VRELAHELAVNPNTVSRAYRDLQGDGVLEGVRGTGLEVTSAAPKRCQRDRVRLISDRLANVLVEARQSGLAAPEIRRLVDQALARLEAKATSK
jgi:GntR family transcriptional regulator